MVKFIGFYFVVLVVALGGCAHQAADPNDPDALFSEAEEALEEERYLIAIEKYRDIKNRFPYSPRAVDSKLRIADTYFAQESYLEAESAYEIFRELHPTHPKSDYVQYRIGLAYFFQIPENSARDLSAAHRAIDALTTLTKRYSNSKYVELAKEKITEARRKLAEYERYVAEFYYERKHFLSASFRYSALLQQYSKLGYDEEALYRLGNCYYQVKMFSNARKALEKLLVEYPKSEFRGSTVVLLKELEGNKK